MIRINQLKMEPDHTRDALEKKIAKSLRLDASQVKAYQIVKRSLDARKKDQIKWIYCVNVSVEKESAVLKRIHDPNIMIIQEKKYTFVQSGTIPLSSRPVIVGDGPCGLFCAYLLAKNGYRPIVLERGDSVEQRVAAVEKFWETGILDTESNVQFGEGGAGTFSDGKLNTQIKDPEGRIRFFLETFVSFGAKEDILFDSKPHIGTDLLTGIVSGMRKKIEAMGGEIRFRAKVTGILADHHKVTGVEINGTETLSSEIVVLAIGHSARDTFEMLFQKNIAMEAKSFAVGVRVEHPQERINQDQYGTVYADCLPHASYKLTTKTRNGRGVYSFCMCPGGYVVNASSEEGMLAVNGMSYSARDGENANSAIIVSVTPEDFPEEGPLAGVAFQRELEKRAYQEGNGKIPLQRFGDFKEKQSTERLGKITPCSRGTWIFGNLWNILPEPLCESLVEGITKFGYNLKGFDDEDTILSGIESRTSSPVRISRNEDGIANIEGLYPAGEGAGYAGGITSAAVDGIRIAEKIAFKYKA